MIRYKNIFGVIRILLGILFIIYPALEFFSLGEIGSEESVNWLFVMIFFLVYAYSSIRNGIREIGGFAPIFNLLRFFEASMNGFLSIYLLIIIFASGLNPYATIVLIIITFFIILSMVRDIRIISLQYFEKKQNARK